MNAVPTDFEDDHDAPEHNTHSSDAQDDETSELVLLFTVEGNAVLEEAGEAVWFSDDDDDFAVEFADRDFLDAEEDKTDVLNYLVDAGMIDENEKEHVDVQEEVEDDT